MSDAADVQRLAGDRAIADTTLNVPHPYEDGMAEAWIGTHAREFAERRLVNFAITLAADGSLLGSIGLQLDRETPGAGELGYWVGVPYWNRGYCTEAATAVLDYGFAELELERIHAHHLLRNPASGRVLAKAGMRREGVARQEFRKGERYEDIVLYGMRREDWQAV
jgi:RimJ/RimL family protein N-acetyltransferase